MPERLKKKLFEPALAALMLCALAFASALPAVAQTRLTATGSEEDVLEESDDLKRVIDQLNDQIAKKKTSVDQLKSQMQAYQKAIEEKRREAASVQSELEIVENKIAKAELDIAANNLEIEATELEISEIGAQIQEKSLKIMRQRQMISEFIRALHKTDQESAIDLFLTQKTLSDFFNDVQFLEDSQRELKKSLDNVLALKADLEKREGEQAAKKAYLEQIRGELEKSKSELGEQQTAQTLLAESIRVSETRYRSELAQLQKEVQNINADIAATERRLRKTLDEERLRRLSGGTGGWGWPVDPSRGITAYFHDPDYPFRHVFEHPAIDIRAAQGTAIRAPKGGYVARAKNAGMGYSYVMLIHDGDISTVYGHVSRIVVQEDTYVEKGDIIAYSGGAPGTPGAGNLTTGPHLHLEFRLGGIPVNPLNYLSL